MKGTVWVVLGSYTETKNKLCGELYEFIFVCLWALYEREAAAAIPLSFCHNLEYHLRNSRLLLYALDSVHLSDSNLKSLTHNWHAIFWKLFGTNDVDCINDIHLFMGYLPLVTEVDARRVGFFIQDYVL